MVDTAHNRSTYIVIWTHAGVEANQWQAASVRARVADRVLRAVAVYRAVDTAEVQINANTPVIRITFVSFITQSEGIALVVFAVTLKLIGICVNCISWIPTSARLVAPLLALSSIQNACILAALPTLHAGAPTTRTAVARALVCLGNAGIFAAFPAFLARASILVSLVLTRTRDDRQYAHKSAKNPKPI
jgi:hypothetical protein